MVSYASVNRAVVSFDRVSVECVCGLCTHVCDICDGVTSEFMPCSVPVWTSLCVVH